MSISIIDVIQSQKKIMLSYSNITREFVVEHTFLYDIDLQPNRKTFYAKYNGNNIVSNVADILASQNIRFCNNEFVENICI